MCRLFCCLPCDAYDAACDRFPWEEISPANPDKSCKVCYSKGGHPRRPCPGPPGCFAPGNAMNPHGLRHAVVPKDYRPPKHLKHVGYIKPYTDQTPKCNLWRSPKYNIWTPHPWAAHQYLATQQAANLPMQHAVPDGGDGGYGPGPLQGQGDGPVH